LCFRISSQLKMQRKKQKASKNLLFLDVDFFRPSRRQRRHAIASTSSWFQVDQSWALGRPRSKLTCWLLLILDLQSFPDKGGGKKEIK
jgi:hypothetical protein